MLIWVRKVAHPKVGLEGTQQVVALEEIREEDPLNGGDMSSPTLGEACCKTTQAQVSLERLTSRLPCRSCGFVSCVP